MAEKISKEEQLFLKVEELKKKLVALRKKIFEQETRLHVEIDKEFTLEKSLNRLLQRIVKLEQAKLKKEKQRETEKTKALTLKIASLEEKTKKLRELLKKERFKTQRERIAFAQAKRRFLEEQLKELSRKIDLETKKMISSRGEKQKKLIKKIKKMKKKEILKVKKAEAKKLKAKKALKIPEKPKKVVKTPKEVEPSKISYASFRDGNFVLEYPKWEKISGVPENVILAVSHNLIEVKVSSREVWSPEQEFDYYVSELISKIKARKHSKIISKNKLDHSIYLSFTLEKEGKKFFYNVKMVEIGDRIYTVTIKGPVKDKEKVMKIAKHVLNSIRFVG